MSNSHRSAPSLAPADISPSSLSRLALLLCDGALRTNGNCLQTSIDTLPQSCRDKYPLISSTNPYGWDQQYLCADHDYEADEKPFMCLDKNGGPPSSLDCVATQCNAVSRDKLGGSWKIAILFLCVLSSSFELLPDTSTLVNQTPSYSPTG